MTQNASIRPVGRSHDGRTNRWMVTPPCGHKDFQPATTMMAIHYVQCPKCNDEFRLDYNNRTITRVEPD